MLNIGTMHSRRDRKRDDSTVATGVDNIVVSSSSLSKSICDPKTGITRIRQLLKTSTSFRGEHLDWAWTSQPALISPKGKPLDSDTVGISGSPGYSH